jgi:hypothetical protein
MRSPMQVKNDIVASAALIAEIVFDRHPNLLGD